MIVLRRLLLILPYASTLLLLDLAKAIFPNLVTDVPVLKWFVANPIPTFVILILISVPPVILSAREKVREMFSAANIPPQITLEDRVALLNKIGQNLKREFSRAGLEPGKRVDYHLKQRLQNPPDWVYMQSSSEENEEKDAPPISERPITEIYTEKKEGLIILGGPGSGKTTLLLKLEKDLLEEAKRDLELPIPVVISLASWVPQQQGDRLETWLVEALQRTYQVPAHTWKQLLPPKQNKLLVLFDGLDEVAPEAQLACIKAIKTFYNDAQPGAHVICSRTEEYLQRKGDLDQLTAVTLQPLTREQVESLLEEEEFRGLRKALRLLGGDSVAKNDGGEEFRSLLDALQQRHGALLDLITVPLWLDILMETCKGLSVEQILPRIDGLSRADELLDYYVEETMPFFEKRGFDEEHTRHWLTWLAQQLVQHGRDDLYLEHLQLNSLLQETAWQLSDTPSMRARQAAAILFFRPSTGCSSSYFN
jgi:NACHT domain